MNYARALLLGAMTVTLQGCIAAAAVPIVAGGGALFRNSISDDATAGSRADSAVVLTGEAQDGTPGEPAPARTDTPAAPASGAERTATPARSQAGLPETAPRSPALATEAAEAQRAELDAADVSATAAAAAAAAANPMEDPATTTAGYAALRSYALSTLDGGLPLPSAVLADSTSLQPDRLQCEGNAPALVVDIDPAGGLVPLAGPLAVNRELGRVLADLRTRGVQIAWITDRGPVDARAVRDRLVAAGLDPDADDTLYVQRYPGETKQARRAALAQNQCIIAVAGDERADFDDLYNFIIDPADASALEALEGNGWFLIDNPVGG